MVLIGFFSILVITATPVGKIPDRIIGAYRWLTGQELAVDNETTVVETTDSQRTHTDHDQSYLYEHDRQPKQKKTRPGFFARLFGAKDPQDSEEQESLAGDEAYSSAVIGDEQVPAVEVLDDEEAAAVPRPQSNKQTQVMDFGSYLRVRTAAPWFRRYRECFRRRRTTS